MQRKEYQQRVLTEVRTYLEHLATWRKKAEDNPEAEIDFADKAWEKATGGRSYVRKRNGIGQPLPNFCLKIPTGGGKTYLAVKAIDIINVAYRRRQTGLVLWIVPSTQIYRQTLKRLIDRDDPYRQHLDIASGGRTKIVEKGDRFSPQDIAENLVVLMLMLPSANRKTKETLRIFKDSGGFHDFFPPEDDIRAQEALLKGFPNLDTYERESAFWGRQIKTSLGNTLRMLSPVIILDEGHKAYSEGAQETLRGFNPCMIMELSATPTKSNVLVSVSGQELNREQMIKLDLHVVNKASPDWKDTLLAGHNKRCVLEEKARKYEASTGVWIRPICLIQVERTGKEQQGGRHIHSEQVREYLQKTLGVPADQIAVKTSEKDELKEVDDVGGLLSRDCLIRYIITKQALQEGWDCSFAYVLAILANPSSKNALTQLVGRVLRQPFARKTGMADLDESYVFCFQQRAQPLLESIRTGFAQEGLGDLRGYIAAEDEHSGKKSDDGGLFGIRDRFKTTASRTILPVFVVKENGSWRAVNYEMDIAAAIPWNELDLAPMKSLKLSMYEEKDMEHVATLADNEHDVVRQKYSGLLREGGIVVDPVFMTRQICDIVPNPWQANEFARRALSFLSAGADEHLIVNNFVFIIEELRKLMERQKELMAERVFQTMLEKGELRFLIISDDLNWTFPKKIEIKPDRRNWTFPRNIKIKPGSRRLAQKNNTPLERSLFDQVPEDEFNETEKAVAWYLEGQERLFFWFRNRARIDYAIQGWREHRIYPDFIFTAAEDGSADDYTWVYVVETKGMHLKDNERTQYTRRLFDICTEKAQSRKWNEFGLEMKGKVLRFEVLTEAEWEAKLNELL